MRRVLATAGRTVFFSSLTVAAALASLLVFPQRFLYSMGLGGALVALFAALISLTVLPAVLTLLGRRVNAGAPRFLQRRAAADARPAEGGFWYRLSRFVMRRPVPVATLSALFLIVLGLPFLGIRFNTVDPTVLPKLGERAAGLRNGQRRVPALPRHADLDRPRRREPGPGARGRRPRRRGAGRRRSAAAPAPDPRRDRDRGDLRQPLRLRRQPEHRAGDPRSAEPGGNAGAGQRRDRRLRRLPGEPRAPPADRARRSSSSPPW